MNTQYGAPQGLTPEQLQKMKRSLMMVLPIVVIVVILGAILSGRAGVKEVKDYEVAVIYNYITGNSKIQTTPGNVIFIPFINEVFTFDKRPNEFLMQGDENKHANHVKTLEVRAIDGSNFWFDEVRIQYQIIPSEIQTVIHDSGPDKAFKIHWLRSYARSILRDEFGRQSAVQNADLSTYAVVIRQAQDRLNNVLNSHGIEVIQIVPPKPKFDKQYENAIEQRKLANQQVDKLIERQKQLLLEKERRLAGIERDKKIEYETLLGSLEAERIKAEQDQVRVEKSADAHKIKRASEGEAWQAKMTAQAAALEEKYRKEAEGLKAKVDALAAQGEIIVREALADKLKEVNFTLVPYNEDSYPQRVQYDEMRQKKGSSK